MKRPNRNKEMDAFLAAIGWENATRTLLAGDASFRRYDRVVRGNEHAVLMDAPPPWEDVRPFIAMTHILEQCDVSVPRILAADEAQGFLLLEDFGDTIFTRVLAQHPEKENDLYHAAVDALVAINHASRANIAWEHTLKPYDEAVYLREVGLFAEWFLPQLVGLQAANHLRTEWLDLWRAVLSSTPLKRSVVVHRDYHADNLLILAHQRAHRAVGMLDYQDALWGDPTYDLVSLLEDARRDVRATTTAQCLKYAMTALHESDDFMQRYAVLGAQRNAKIIGIFARLCVRDGKPHYLEYLPRVWGHFLKDIAHPHLSSVRVFIDAHVPPSHRGTFAANPAIGGIVHET